MNGYGFKQTGTYKDRYFHMLDVMGQIRQQEEQPLIKTCRALVSICQQHTELEKSCRETQDCSNYSDRYFDFYFDKANALTTFLYTKPQPSETEILDEVSRLLKKEDNWLADIIEEDLLATTPRGTRVVIDEIPADRFACLASDYTPLEQRFKLGEEFKYMLGVVYQLLTLAQENSVAVTAIADDKYEDSKKLKDGIGKKTGDSMMKSLNRTAAFAASATVVDDETVVLNPDAKVVITLPGNSK